MMTFRHWVEELYYQNCDEHADYCLPDYTLVEYFNRYKWWLRREYRHQMATKNTNINLTT